MKTKNYLKQSLFIIVALSLITSCGNSGNQQKNENNDTVQTGSTDQQARLAGGGPIPLPACEKTFIIPLSDINTMTSKYKTERLQATNTNLRTRFNSEMADPESVWFPLEEFECFLKKVKDEIAEKNLPDQYKFSGLRVYFTVYPERNRAGESEYLSGIPDDMRNRASFVILPTYTDAATNKHLDLIPETIQNTISGNTARHELSCIGYNHVALCPPNCPN